MAKPLTVAQLMKKIDQNVKLARESSVVEDPDEVKKDVTDAGKVDVVAPDGVVLNKKDTKDNIPTTPVKDGDALEESKSDKVASINNIAKGIILNRDTLSKVASKTAAAIEKGNTLANAIFKKAAMTKQAEEQRLQKLASDVNSYVSKLNPLQKYVFEKHAAIHADQLSKLSSQEEINAYINGVKLAEAMAAEQQAAGSEDLISQLIQQLVAQQVITPEAGEQLMAAAQQGPEAFIAAVAQLAQGGQMPQDIAQQIVQAVQQGEQAGAQMAAQQPEAAPQQPEQYSEIPTEAQKVAAATLQKLARYKYAAVAEGEIPVEDAQIEVADIVPGLIALSQTGEVSPELAQVVVEEVMNSPEISDEEKQIVLEQVEGALQEVIAADEAAEAEAKAESSAKEEEKEEGTEENGEEKECEEEVSEEDIEKTAAYVSLAKKLKKQGKI